MTDVADAPQPAPMSSARPWKVATLVCAVLAVVALAVAAYAVGRDDTASPVTAMPMRSSMPMMSSTEMPMGDADAMYEQCVVVHTPAGEATTEDTAEACRAMADRMGDMPMLGGRMPMMAP